MPTGKWLDRSQPQTLINATMLLYVNAALNVLWAVLGLSVLWLAIAAGQAVAGYGIANEKKWAYWLAVALTVLVVAQLVLSAFSGFGILTVAFYVVLLVLLLHPQSREYRRIWFR